MLLVRFVRFVRFVLLKIVTHIFHNKVLFARLVRFVSTHLGSMWNFTPTLRFVRFVRFVSYTPYLTLKEPGGGPLPHFLLYLSRLIFVRAETSRLFLKSACAQFQTI